MQHSPARLISNTMQGRPTTKRRGTATGAVQQLLQSCRLRKEGIYMVTVCWRHKGAQVQRQREAELVARLHFGARLQEHTVPASQGASLFYKDRRQHAFGSTVLMRHCSPEASVSLQRRKAGHRCKRHASCQACLQSRPPSHALQGRQLAPVSICAEHSLGL